MEIQVNSMISILLLWRLTPANSIYKAVRGMLFFTYGGNVTQTKYLVNSFGINLKKGK
jgi:hypothetical protein